VHLHRIAFKITYYVNGEAPGREDCSSLQKPLNFSIGRKKEKQRPGRDYWSGGGHDVTQASFT